MRKTVDSIPGFFTPDMFATPKVAAPTHTTRQELLMYVQNYSMEKCGPDKNNYVPYLKKTWRYLYGRLKNSSVRIDPYARARSMGTSNKLAAMDLMGYTDELYAIAKRDLK